MQAVTDDAHRMSIAENQLSDPKGPLQTLSTDILALVVEELSSHPTELFAPLICSRVCSHWRRSILGTSSLWSFIDTSRGPRFTELWLANSNQSMLDIRLSDQPLRRQHLKRMPLHMPLLPSQHLFDPIPESIKSQAHRWKSLDISLSCTCRVSKALQFLNQNETILLDSLIVGPMGKTVMVDDDKTARPYFGTISAQPSVIRSDSYFVYLGLSLFSPRLTVLEVRLGGVIYFDAPLIQWREILLSAPNLVELSLLDSQSRSNPAVQLSKNSSPVELRNLRKLSLSGRVTQLCKLFAESPLPNLQYLSFDMIESCHNIDIVLPKYLATIASTSPELSHVSIGSMSYVQDDDNAVWWAKAFQSLQHSLRELTFVEMEWREVALALNQLVGLPHKLSLVRLERIWDLESYDWTRLQSPEGEMPTIEHIDTAHGGSGRCYHNSDDGIPDASEAGSDYDTEFEFEYPHRAYPPSEELDSDESELSYDSYDDSLQSGVDEDENVTSEVESCMWGYKGLVYA